VVSDDAIKVVLFNNHVVLGYTGVAEFRRPARVAADRNVPVETVGTNQWVAEVLSIDVGGLDQRFALLQQEAEALSLNHALGVLGVGFIRQTDSSPLEPFAVLLSNMNPRRRFELDFYGLQPSQRFVVVQSAPSGQDFERGLRERLRQIMRGPGSPNLVGDAFAEVIRDVSGPGSTVGGGILEACIPRQAVQRFLERNELLIAEARPRTDWVTVRHLPTAGESTKRVGPMFVVGGIIAGQILLGPHPLTVQTHLAQAPTE
jgi:hypothetical protein